MKTLTENNYRAAAELLGVDVATVKAVAEVESAGGGFLANGQPKILFEGHWFHKLTGGKYTNPENANISYPKWITTYYNENQHARLAKAVRLDREAALKSASWGKFQIMGFNYAKAGFDNLQSFINAMYRSEGAQLIAFVNFVKNTGLDAPLKRKDWAGFARGYNGSGYAKNKYDIKLANAYKKHSK